MLNKFLQKGIIMAELKEKDELIEKKQYASILTRITSLYVDRLASAILKPMGLSLAEYKILYVCINYPDERITNSFLESHFQMSHSTSVGLLNHLEKDGWINRISNPDNKREKIVVLTAMAQQQKDTLLKAGQELEDQFTANLTKEEVEEYIHLSKKIME